MTKIVLDTVSSGYNLGKINANFEKIEDQLNDKVLYRDNTDTPTEPNELEQDLDLNSNRILNLPVPTSPTEPLRYGDITSDETGATVQYVDDSIVVAVDEATNTTVPQNIINDLSQSYEFPTVAAYKAFTTAFPVGKVIDLLDRQAEFTVISGTGTATAFDIIASSQVSQSISLVDKGTTSLVSIGLSVGNTDVENGLVIDYINTSYAANKHLYMPNGTYNSNKGFFPTVVYRLEGESQLGATLNVTDVNQDCHTHVTQAGVVKHMTFKGGRDGHRLGDEVGTAGRELEMHDVLFLLNAGSGRVFNMGWACKYSKIKIFKPTVHFDHWRALGFTNNVMTSSIRTSGLVNNAALPNDDGRNMNVNSILVDGATLRNCGYEGEIIIEGNAQPNSVSIKSTAGSLDGFKVKGFYGETHNLGYIDFSQSVCHDVEVSGVFIGYIDPLFGDTVYGIKDAVGMHIHDCLFTGDVIAPITSVSACLVLNCYARDKAGSYSKNLIYDPLDGDKVKMSSSVVYNLGDKMNSALSMPGYFQGEIPVLSAASQHVFGVRSVGYLPDGNDLDHMMHFRKFGTDTYAMETIPLKIKILFNGTDYVVSYAPEGTIVALGSTGFLSITLPTGTLGNSATSRFSHAEFVSRRVSGRRLMHATAFVENSTDDIINVQIYNAAGTVADLVSFEQIHVSVSFVNRSA